MESQIDTKREQQQTAPRGHYAHPIGEGGLVLYLSNREREHAEHHRNEPRWHHGVGRRMGREWRAFKGGLRRWATVAIMFATLVNVGVAYYQWKTAQGQLKEMRGSSADTKTVADAAKRSAEVAEKTLVLSQRPWVSAYLTLNGPFEFSSNGDASLNMRYVLANVGHSVAEGVEMLIEMFPFTISQGNFYEPWERQKELCENAKKSRSRTPHILGYAMFPNEPLSGDRTVTLKQKDIAASIALPALRLSNTQISPMLIGCVTYKFTFSPEYHATGFIYNIYRREPTQPKGDLLIEINKSLPQENVKLEFFPFGGRYAD